MSKVALVALVLFVIAMVLPDLRTVMLVGGVGVMIGYMVGSQQAARHTAALSYNRLLRNVGSSQPVYSGDGEQWQS
jgi:hypothetical protein